MTALKKLQDNYRQASASEGEKGTYFEELVRTYLSYEATYADLDARDPGLPLLKMLTKPTRFLQSCFVKLYVARQLR